MSGLRFASVADMPPRMREAYARQVLPEARAQQSGPGSGSTARRRRGGTTS